MYVVGQALLKALVSALKQYSAAASISSVVEIVQVSELRDASPLSADRISLKRVQSVFLGFRLSFRGGLVV